MQTTKTIAVITKDNSNYELKLNNIGHISSYKGYQLDYFNKLETFITDDNKLGLWFYIDDQLIMMDEVNLNRKITIKQQLINEIPVNMYYIK